MTLTTNSGTMIYEETLDIIRSRYIHQKAIYTWCGIALVAVNPYQDLDIYGNQAVETYHSAAHSGYLQLDPHIYAVTEDAYSKLERDLRNQSIIVSGESGAGKTVSAKLAMKYFASVASSRAKLRIESRVLASNPIMEAIGNSSTARNDNSSRFGKYIQIFFDKQNRKMLGANMRTYLLEKSRVTKQQAGERNFHIFYQLLNYARKHPKQTSHLKLTDPSAKPFKYLGGIEPNEIEDDLEKFQEAFKTLGLDERKCDIVYKVIAGILHGGNMEFKQDGDDSCRLDSNDFHLKVCCELLGFKLSDALTMLTTQRIHVRSDVILKPMNCSYAEYGRDAMFKSLYHSLFIFLVGLINLSLSRKNRDLNDDTPVLKSPSVKKTFLDPPTEIEEPQFIGVLDIYGFENFQTNSFEQFFINYANEVLQQQFNQHVFKLEQEEYICEGIDWTFIEFTDNQPVIDIIESKPIGILNLLDEECRMPKGTDVTWCAKLHQQLKSIPNSSAIFKRPKFDNETTFTICHYAEEVMYTVDTFLEKNRDTLWAQQSDLLEQSEVLRQIFDESNCLAQTANDQFSKAKTIGGRFRLSLASLMTTLNSTEPHYIRCIKPNDGKKAFVFEDDRAVEQLRACGVYETIRISANGFPSRWLYKDFAKRYSVLVRGTEPFKKLINSANRNEARQANSCHLISKLNSRDGRSVSEAICELTYTQGVYNDLLLPLERDYIEELKSKAINSTTSPIFQFGKTKIFFRSRQVGFLERIRSHRHRMFAINIQRHIRGWLARKFCKRLREEMLEKMRREKATLLIQTQWRRYSARHRYLIVVGAVLRLQCFAKQRFAKKNASAVAIQKSWKGYLCRQAFKRELEKIIIVQSSIRRFLARKQYKRMRSEAHSVERMKTVNHGLERKIIELQQKINETNLNHKKEIASFKKELEKAQATTRSMNSNIALLQLKQEREKSQSSAKFSHYSSMFDGMYQMLVRILYAQIQPIVVNAVLEYDGLDSSEPFASLESRPQSTSEHSLAILLSELEAVYELIVHCKIDREISLLIYKQLFYLICAQCLNQLLLRKDLCHWNKAIQIRFNLSCLEQWCREKQLYKWQEIVEQLDPITQSTKLLQTRKTSEHIPTIVEMCSKLRPSQIIKILNMYTSSYEEQISTDFMHELEEYLYKNMPQKTEIQIKEGDIQLEANNNNNVPSLIHINNDLLMDTKQLFTLSGGDHLHIR